VAILAIVGERVNDPELVHGGLLHSLCTALFTDDRWRPAAGLSFKVSF